MSVSRKIYCLDTSGLSNPLETNPEDLYPLLWNRICILIESGIVAVNTEIYNELLHIEGNVGACIKRCKSELLLEIGENDWNWEDYITHVERMRVVHKSIISEYNDNRKRTVGLNDVSIVALAKSLSLPIVSMEALTYQPSDKFMRIPQLCKTENVQHMTFNDLLRKEKIKL